MKCKEKLQELLKCKEWWPSLVKILSRTHNYLNCLRSSSCSDIINHSRLEHLISNSVFLSIHFIHTGFFSNFIAIIGYCSSKRTKTNTRKTNFNFQTSALNVAMLRTRITRVCNAWMPLFCAHTNRLFFFTFHSPSFNSHRIRIKWIDDKSRM